MSRALILDAYRPAYAELLAAAFRARRDAARARPFDAAGYLAATSDADMVAQVMAAQAQLRAEVAS